ncbi:hypothetical protein PspLS_01956, partial [Pyricularia sp. CBS 133598]
GPNQRSKQKKLTAQPSEGRWTATKTPRIRGDGGVNQSTTRPGELALPGAGRMCLLGGLSEIRGGRFGGG